MFILKVRSKKEHYYPGGLLIKKGTVPRVITLEYGVMVTHMILIHIFWVQVLIFQFEPT